ncbi:MAG: squalene/phytoene synthase family protein, partial [Pseudomonadota bacterium]
MSNNNATNQTDSKSPQTIQHIPLPPPGCDWYYSLLKTTEAQQEAVAALLALNHALYTAATAQKDPSIAHKKLAWWDEELKRLFNGTPTHPITQALLPMMTMYTWPKAYFDDMFAGAIFIRDATRAFSEHQLKIQGQRAFGAVFALCGGVFV